MACCDQCGGRMSVADRRACDNRRPLRAGNGTDSASSEPHRL
jgi:hypothetical protein